MQKLAHRLERLGTETAFSVAQAAAAWKAKGNLVYPFHLGDINIPTAPHIRWTGPLGRAQVVFDELPRQGLDGWGAGASRRMRPMPSWFKRRRFSACQVD